LTQFPLKQGGIATQQADVAAASIAAHAGADIEPHPFRPVLRGLLLTGMTPRYLAERTIASSAKLSAGC
jgi:sulfide:quinone oxidoreductase